MAVSFMLPIFTDFVQDTLVKIDAGYLMLSIFIANSLINIVLLSYQHCYMMYYTLKRLYYKLRLKLRLRSLLKNKNEAKNDVTKEHEEKEKQLSVIDEEKEQNKISEKEVQTLSDYQEDNNSNALNAQNSLQNRQSEAQITNYSLKFIQKTHKLWSPQTNINNDQSSENSQTQYDNFNPYQSSQNHMISSRKSMPFSQFNKKILSGEDNFIQHPIIFVDQIQDLEEEFKSENQSDLNDTLNRTDQQLISPVMGTIQFNYSGLIRNQSQGILKKRQSSLSSNQIFQNNQGRHRQKRLSLQNLDQMDNQSSRLFIGAKKQLPCINDDINDNSDEEKEEEEEEEEEEIDDFQ